MGKRIRVQRKGRSPNYNSVRKGRKGPAKLRQFDSYEKNSYLIGTVMSIEHDRGRGVPLARIRFPIIRSDSLKSINITNSRNNSNEIQNEKSIITNSSNSEINKDNITESINLSKKEFFNDSLKSSIGKKKKGGLEEIMVVAVEGIYEGKKVFFGEKAPLEVGNCLPVGKMPEGTVISSVESTPGDRSRLAKQSGGSATIIGHTMKIGSTENEFTQVKLPSGVKKTISSKCRAIVGVPAAGGRLEKPLYKAGKSFHKTKAGRKNWPVVRGVAMSAVDHPHGGGNHQHVGRSTCVSRNAPPGQKVGLIAARRTGRLRGTSKNKFE